MHKSLRNALVALLLCVFTASAWSALTVNQQWRVVPSGGSELNGGGFDPSLTAGMLTDGAATSATGATPTFSSASYSCAAGDVGALLYIAAGTNWTPGWYPIASCSGNDFVLTAAVDATLGGARLANGNALTTSGVATTASPTGATFTIDYSAGTMLALTDLASTASTTVTSASNPFKPVHVGNIIRLASATGSPVADSAGSRYLAIVTYTDAANVVVDKTSGTYTAGVARIGGPFATWINLSDGGTLNGILTSPLGPGHIINIKGGGTDNPAAADYTPGGNAVFPSGTAAGGLVRFIGYNGRPHMAFSGSGGPGAFRIGFAKFSNLKFSAITAGGGFMIDQTGAAMAGNDFENIYYDQKGFDNQFTSNAGSVHNSWFFNTGSTSAGTMPVVKGSVHGGSVTSSRFQDLRGYAFLSVGGEGFIGNIVTNMRCTTCGAINMTAAEDVGRSVLYNTFDGNQGHGILIGDKTNCWFTLIVGNLFTNNVGYGINPGIGGAQADKFFAHIPNYNAYYNNTAGNLAALSAGANDVLLSSDPYVNRAGGNFNLNQTTLARGAGMGPPDPGGSTLSRPNIGAMFH